LYLKILKKYLFLKKLTTKNGIIKKIKSSPKKSLKRFTTGKNRKKGQKETEFIAQTFLNSSSLTLDEIKEKSIEFSIKNTKTKISVIKIRNKKLTGISKILNKVDRIKKYVKEGKSDKKT